MKSLLALTLFVSCVVSHAEPNVYDPLQVDEGEVVSEKYKVRDSRRNREIPLRIYFPRGGSSAPVIIFSHGLGGSCDNNVYLGIHWAKRGYVVVFVQHPGSDESVWKNVAAKDRMAAMKGAASVKSYRNRIKDIPEVIDTLTAWNAQPDHALFARFDLDRLGMAGHSFGARTTQAMAGEKLGGGKFSFAEKRVTAALMMSPSGAKFSAPVSVFSGITIPCLFMTGSLDTSPIGGSSVEDRLGVFPHVGGAAWQVTFEGAKHSAFGQRRGHGEGEFHERILALTTAFWDAHLKNNESVKKWLNGDGAKAVLADEDFWELNGK